MNTLLLGKWGEAVAAEYLRKKKYAIIDAGYRTRYGELDLVAENKTHLVFVEVKLRKNADFAAGREYVDSRKQKRIRTTAAFYISQNPSNLRSRFDVIEIYAPAGTATPNPEIIHLEDAFQ